MGQRHVDRDGSRDTKNESGLDKGQAQGSEVSGSFSGRACGLFLTNAVLSLGYCEEGFPVSLPTGFLNFYFP